MKIEDSRLAGMDSGPQTESVVCGGDGEFVCAGGGLTVLARGNGRAQIISQHSRELEFLPTEPVQPPDTSNFAIGEETDRTWDFQEVEKQSQTDLSVEVEFKRVLDLAPKDRGRNLEFQGSPYKVVNMDGDPRYDMEANMPEILRQDSRRVKGYVKDSVWERKVCKETVETYREELLKDVGEALRGRVKPAEVVKQRLKTYLTMHTSLAFSIVRSMDVEQESNHQGEPYFVFKYDGEDLFGKSV